MTDKDKKTQARVVPKISQAPEPSSPIRGGGYSLPRNTPARYEHWNYCPAVTIDQFTYLIFGCEPGTKLIWNETQKRADLLLLIHAHEAVDTFPKPIDPWAVNPLYAAVELIEWGEPLGYRAEDWKPIHPEPTDDIEDATAEGRSIENTVEQVSEGVDYLRREEFVNAAIIMKESQQQIAPRNQAKVVGFIELYIDQFTECQKLYEICEKRQAGEFVNSLRRSIRRTGVINPLQGQRYSSANSNIHPDLPW